MVCTEHCRWRRLHRRLRFATAVCKCVFYKNSLVNNFCHISQVSQDSQSVPTSQSVFLVRPHSVFVLFIIISRRESASKRDIFRTSACSLDATAHFVIFFCLWNWQHLWIYPVIQCCAQSGTKIEKKCSVHRKLSFRTTEQSIHFDSKNIRTHHSEPLTTQIARARDQESKTKANTYMCTIEWRTKRKKQEKFVEKTRHPRRRLLIFDFVTRSQTRKPIRCCLWAHSVLRSDSWI